MKQKRVSVAVAALLAAQISAQAKLPNTEADRIADAIYLAEGGTKAKRPYGVLSVKVAGPADARKVCLRTIQNNHDRWQAAGRPGTYLDFLADRYCPPSADPKGNKNWKANVRALLAK